jgi:hypothetical protein
VIIYQENIICVTDSDYNQVQRIMSKVNVQDLKLRTVGAGTAVGIETVKGLK